MVKVFYEAERCKGCHYCIDVCPKKCVTLSGDTNLLGYSTVQFNEEECIACGSCYAVCPDYAITITKED